MKLNVTIDTDANAVDIPSMHKMPLDEYASYVDGGLFFVDHHEVLRAVLGEYPIATTSKQVEHLISYLQVVAEKMRGGER
ncbi:hypothetical protein D3C81_727770 [compost metagenome]